jgi:G3E family GTPase
MRIAVIVNDMASLNIDASFIQKTGFIQTKEEFVSMQNGCICCTLRYDLLKAIKSLSEMNKFDYIVIESTGIAEPMQVAETFTFDPNETGADSHHHPPAKSATSEDIDQSLFHHYARLDTCVTVLDCVEFFSQIKSHQTYAEKYSAATNANRENQAHEAAETNSAEEEKHISHLLIEQVEFANVIIVNKIDLIPDDGHREQRLEEMKQLLSHLNTKARILFTSYSNVDLNDVLNTGLFSMEEAQNAPGWLQSLAHGAEHNTETAEYGISSFVYRSRRPFHPERLLSLVYSGLDLTLTNEFGQLVAHPNHLRRAIDAADQSFSATDRFVPSQLIRSKGFCWVATRDDAMIEWNHNGRILSLNPLMSWYIDMKTNDPEAWNDLSIEEQERIAKDFAHPHLGDRRNEVVLIGIHLNQKHLTKLLEAALLTDEEYDAFISIKLGNAGARKPSSKGIVNCFYDPLPAWARSLDQPGLFATVIRKGQSLRMDVPLGHQLQVHSLTLNLNSALFTAETQNEMDQNVLQIPLSDIMVQVWLDIYELGSQRPLLQESLLLSTLTVPLGPNSAATSKVHGLGLTLSSKTQEEGEGRLYEIRIELQHYRVIEPFTLNHFLKGVPDKASKHDVCDQHKRKRTKSSGMIEPSTFAESNVFALPHFPWIELYVLGTVSEVDVTAEEEEEEEEENSDNDA